MQWVNKLQGYISPILIYLNHELGKLKNIELRY